MGGGKTKQTESTTQRYSVSINSDIHKENGGEKKIDNKMNVTETLIEPTLVYTKNVGKN